MFSIAKIFTFEAAHYLRNYDGPCSQIHGHSYTVQVTLHSALSFAQLVDSNNAMVLDFRLLSNAAQSLIIGKFDHKCLNDVTPFTEVNPTAEAIAFYIHVCFEKMFKDNQYVVVHRVDVWETATSCASYWEEDSMEYKTINEMRKSDGLGELSNE